MRNKLYRSRDRVIAGVCSGVADWLGLSTTLVRFLTALITICSAGIPMVTIYIVMALVVPKEPRYRYYE